MTRRRERIVVGTDFTAAGEAAVRRVETLCTHQAPAQVDLVYVIAPLAVPSAFQPIDTGFEQVHEHEATAALATTAARLRRRLGPQARVATHVLHGAPWEQLCALATRRGASLVVVGRHARPGLQQAIVGSVADRVVRFAPCSVLVVPYAGAPAPSPRKRPRTRSKRGRPIREQATR